MPEGLISGMFNEGIPMKCFWPCVKSDREYKFPCFDIGTRPLFRVSPLFKIWITESPKMFRQIFVDLFVITKKDH